MAKSTDRRADIVLGFPLKYIKGHESIGRRPSARTRAKIAASNTGKRQSAEVLARLSVIRTGKKQSAASIEKRRKANTGRKRTAEFRSLITALHRNRSEQTRKRIAAAKTGPANPMWNGGTTEPRCQTTQIKWAQAVKRRDNYTCQSCGLHSKRGLEAHHIYAFAKYPEKRTDLDNGVTLCKPCHWKMKKHTAPKTLLDMCFSYGT